MSKTESNRLLFKTDRFLVFTFFCFFCWLWYFFGHFLFLVITLFFLFFLCKSMSVSTTTTYYDVCMFANWFFVFRTRGNNAVWKDEHEQTEIKTATVSVFKTKRTFFFFEYWKTKLKLRFRDEENRKPNRLSNFQTVASLLRIIMTFSHTWMQDNVKL